jgi:adenosylcobinamide kinase/adenosylcobinamide-phosphate guanylyltransferase
MLDSESPPVAPPGAAAPIAATAAHELILGGAKSGKSRAAESRAAHWLAGGADRLATLVATALPGEATGDAEMARRIERHRAGRGARLPALETVEAPAALGATLRGLDDPRRLIVVDCLTLWVTQCLLPPAPVAGAARRDGPALSWAQERDELIAALRALRSPVALVSNEIGLGMLPLSPEAREVVDALGLLHQAVAGHCARVTLMVAGCECRVK